MGVLRPIINRMQTHAGEKAIPPTSDRRLTVPNVMTLSRPVLGGIAAVRLGRGRPAAKIAAVAGATDMEGWVGRLGDKIKSGSFLGTSTVGEEGDPAHPCGVHRGLPAGRRDRGRREFRLRLQPRSRAGQPQAPRSRLRGGRVVRPDLPQEQHRDRLPGADLQGHHQGV